MLERMHGALGQQARLQAPARRGGHHLGRPQPGRCPVADRRDRQSARRRAVRRAGRAERRSATSPADLRAPRRLRRPRRRDR
ncbi:hypothetical protein G5V59_01130 [Nocardioides sp. W3-2-3]|uniref:hypothetical protein n=1 Tax=Nocardioides convexus TaxID=2712224 RepID=UPI0024187E02|nr:hypothetical protein [Nocardioides convexus]NGZ99499.1 hypothetical protein [Nocardioides convexus]